MKKNILSIILFLFSNTSLQSHVDDYKNVKFLEYELFRNDKSIGYHNYKFENNGNLFLVNSIIKFKISKLGLDIYKYEASSVEHYKDSQLVKFSSKTNQNKKIKNTDIILDKNQLLVSGSENKLTTSKKHPVGTWWNHEIIQAKAQISAISGRVIEQKVVFLGKEEVKLYGKTYNALHYNFSSSDESLADNKKLNTDVWYDEKTKLWLKASFNKTGRWEYRLKNILN
ncbi:DUF6134 family protein [Pelagibacteraceae bacterium]|jgi:hypothetical protein|nr:DUF6134 family protein [Pelagibacteraceae bacterium]